MPWRIAPAWPVTPPPSTLIWALYVPSVPGDPERHADVGLVDGVAEVLLQGAIVDDDLARPRNEPDPSDRGLAATGPVEEGRGGHDAPRQASGSGRWAWCGCSGPA